MRINKTIAYGSAILLLVGAGTLLRWVRVSRAAEAAVYTPLVSPLRELPQQIGFYTFVRDVPVASSILDVAGVDASIQREYVDVVSGRHLSLYIGYWGRENQGMGHGPEICYPAVGWTSVRTPTDRTLSILGLNGQRSAGISVHRFTRTEPEGVERRIVGFTTIASGHISGSSLEMFWHRPGRLGGQPGHYLAQVQVSCTASDESWKGAESDIVGFLEAFLPHLIECLPHSIDDEL